MIVINSCSELTFLVTRLEDGFETDGTDAFLVFEYLIPLSFCNTISLDESLVPNLVGHAAPAQGHGDSHELGTPTTMDQSHVHDRSVCIDTLSPTQDYTLQNIVGMIR